MDVKTLSKRKRLELISTLLGEVVPGISTIREVLLESGDESNAAFIAAAALGRLGWIADQSLALASGEPFSDLDEPDYWLLGSRNVLSELRWEARDAARKNSALTA